MDKEQTPQEEGSESSTEKKKEGELIGQEIHIGTKSANPKVEDV